MESSLKEFKKILRKNSLYVTRQRVALFKLLLNEPKPLPLQDVANKLDDKLDLVTVYRNIESLEKIQVIKKIYTGWSYRVELSEKFRAHHHHLTCTQCSKTIRINLSDKIENELRSIGKSHDFVIKSHEVELYGLCKSCRSRKDN